MQVNKCETHTQPIRLMSTSVALINSLRLDRLPSELKGFRKNIKGLRI